MPNSKQNRFKVQYDGELQEINALTFINSMRNITDIIEEINNEINNTTPSDKHLEIRIKAVEKGSFIVDMELLHTTGAILLGLVANDHIPTILNILTQLFNLRKILKSDKIENPKLINNYTSEVTTKDGNTVIVNNGTINLYNNNTRVNKSISDNFKALEADENISGFKLIGEDRKELFETKREEFPDLTKSYYEEDKKNRIKEEVARLNIIKAAFDGSLWKFIYLGTKISAKITDDKFLNRINNNEKFSKGDVLDVDLKIQQIYDSNFKTYVNKTYEVTRVIKHIIPEEGKQLSIED